MIYHFVVGDEAATRLREAIETEPSMAGEVVVLKDILHVGPIRKEEGQSFSELRSSYWQEVGPNEKSPIQVDDMERMLQVSGAMYKDETAVAWVWMSPSPADVCAYYWLMPYLSKHMGRFYILNLAGLPFLNEAGKVYYPKGLGEILARELVKARRLARLVTPSEMEVDGDEWQKLVEENGGVRTLEGGKKIHIKEVDFYDGQLFSFCSGQPQKAARIIKQAMQKYPLPTGDLWLHWRLRKMAEEGRLSMQGEEVRLAGADAVSEETAANDNEANMSN